MHPVPTYAPRLPSVGRPPQNPEAGSVGWKDMARLALLLLLGAAACAPPPGPVTLPDAPSDSLRVWAVAGGWHAALIVEQPDGWALGPPGQERAPFVELDWGERRWYMEEDHIWALVSALWPTESVMHVRAWARPPEAEDGFHLFAERRVSPEAYRTLVEAIERAFVREDDGTRAEPHEGGAQYGGRFYPGRVRYTVAHNSNAWVVARLREAGLAERGFVPILFASQVRGRLGDEWTVAE